VFIACARSANRISNCVPVSNLGASEALYNCKPFYKSTYERSRDTLSPSTNHSWIARDGQHRAQLNSR
jgi:hypothetical protein